MTQSGQDPLTLLVAGRVDAVYADREGSLRPDGPQPSVLLPGAFNPVHAGHRGLADAATRLTGQPVVFELSALNVDKPPLAVAEIRRRLGPLREHGPVWVTRASTFVEKAAFFPGVVFVIGADTAARIVAPRYYGDSERQMTSALDRIRYEGCRFLVAGRVDTAGHFLGCRDLELPAAHRDLFEPIPESEFRLDVSSTQLRDAPSSEVWLE